VSAIVIEGVERRFGDNVALRDVNLQVREGEFFSLLGPSGCGKTTLLNVIAGFLDPTQGTVRIGGADVTGLPPYRRHIGMVFQNYALFPHLSVFDNVAYGLKVRKRPAAAVRERVQQALAMVRLEGYAERMPHQLSGGQQQRVAIARALAIEPQVLLLDEPLSNLDAKLRKAMQTELRSLQRRVGITTILVTHDQEEALSLSDRIGILGHGELQQVGAPQALYRRPANRFVAEFIGQVNLIEARRTDPPGTEGVRYLARHHLPDEDAPLALEIDLGEQPAPEAALLMLRPERIHVRPRQAAGVAGVAGLNRAAAVLQEVSYAGPSLRLHTRLAGGGELVVQAADTDFAELPQPGLELLLSWSAQDLVMLPAESAP